MNNIRANVGTDFTVIVILAAAFVDDFEVDSLRGNLCNPEEVAALAEFLKKWENNDEVIVDLSID